MKKIIAIIATLLCITLITTNTLFASTQDENITFNGKTYNIKVTQSIAGKKIIVSGDGEETTINTNILFDTAEIETTKDGQQIIYNEFDKNIENTQYSEAEDHYDYSKIASRSLDFNGKRNSYYISQDLSKGNKSYRCTLYADGKKKERFYKTIPAVVHRFKSEVDSAKANSNSCCKGISASTTGVVVGILGGSLTLGITTILAAIAFIGGSVSAAWDYKNMLDDLSDIQFIFKQI